jgi:hypothetical protein
MAAVSGELLPMLRSQQPASSYFIVISSRRHMRTTYNHLFLPPPSLSRGRC